MRDSSSASLVRHTSWPGCGGRHYITGMNIIRRPVSQLDKTTNHQTHKYTPSMGCDNLKHTGTHNDCCACPAINECIPDSFHGRHLLNHTRMEPRRTAAHIAVKQMHTRRLPLRTHLHSPRVELAATEHHCHRLTGPSRLRRWQRLESCGRRRPAAASLSLSTLDSPGGALHQHVEHAAALLGFLRLAGVQYQAIAAFQRRGELHHNTKRRLARGWALDLVPAFHKRGSTRHTGATSHTITCALLHTAPLRPASTSLQKRLQTDQATPHPTAPLRSPASLSQGLHSHHSPHIHAPMSRGAPPNQPLVLRAL